MNTRKILIISLVAAAMVLTAVPVVGKGPAPKATGDAWAAAGSATLHVEFNAHGTDPAKGNFEYSNSLGGWFTGTVTCYHQAGNEAAFGGMVLDGNYSEPYFLIEVQDNGEGSKATGPDAVRVRLFTSMPACSISGSFPGVVYEGNLQVH